MILFQRYKDTASDGLVPLSSQTHSVHVGRNGSRKKNDLIQRGVDICHYISGDLWAGAEVMAYHLICRQSELAGFRVSAVVCNQGELSAKLAKAGVDVTLLDEKRMSSLEIFHGLIDHMRRRKPRILHCHRYKENIYGYLASKSTTQLILVATQHGMPESFQGFATLKSRVLTQCNFAVLKRYNAVVAVSSDIRNSLITRHGFHESKTWIIRNGISIPPEVVRRSSDKGFVIGSAGRLVPVKDYDLMVRMAAEIVRQVPDVKFVLAGDGPGKVTLQAKIKELDLTGRFKLLGAINNMEKFYKSIDTYINTSVHEGIPMTILEAMSHGVPVVACNVGGIGEIIEDGRNGFLVSSRDPSHLAEKCISLQKDCALWGKISKAGRQKIETSFSDISMAQQYLSLYEQLLDKSDEG